MDLVIIYNPAAGKGRAGGRMAGLRRYFGTRADFRPTRHAGHAEELAYEAACGGACIVGAAGGDGTVHEVANGLMRAARPDTALAIFPVGSANDYAYSLGQAEDWWRALHRGEAFRAVDVGLVRSGRGLCRYFINGFGLGFNGSVTAESRRIRRFQGQVLYTLALLRALCYRYVTPTIAVRLDDHTRTGPTLALSIALGRREGNFLIAPKAIVDDGLFDYLQAGPLPRWELLRHVPGMLTGNLPTDHPQLWMGRCQRATIHAQEPVPVHLDGELFCLPPDGETDFEIELKPGALRLLQIGR